MRLRDNISLETINKVSLFRIFALTAAIVAVAAGCLIILAPFMPAILLGVIFTLATWPAFSWLEKKLNHRTTLAATLMTLLLAVGFLVPLLVIANSLTGNFTKLWAALVTSIETSDGHPPGWVAELPFISDYALSFWEKYLSDMQTLSASLKENAREISDRLLIAGGIIGRGVIDLSLGVFIAFFLFRHGVQTAERLSALIDKFIGQFGQHLLEVSKKTMIGVLYGILGTAVVQAVLATIGFTFAGIPGAALLGLLTFFFSFVPFGPPLIWVPAAMWLFSESQIGMGIFMALWGLLVISMTDNIIRPYFISIGSNLPLLLVLLGVFGGILAFGFIGLFIGPTLLAIAYTVIIAWSNKQAVEAGIHDDTHDV